MDISIDIQRSFSIDLLEALNVLLPQLSSSGVLLDEPHLRALLEHESTHLFTACYAGRIIGMLTLVVYPLPTGVKGWIEDVVVESEYRGRGVAKALLQEALSFSKANHIKKLDLTSSPARVAANLLYQHVGFEKRETNVYRLQ